MVYPQMQICKYVYIIGKAMNDEEKRTADLGRVRKTKGQQASNQDSNEVYYEWYVLLLC